MANATRRPGETNAQFAARLRDEIAQLPRAWGAEDMAGELRALASWIGHSDFRGDLVLISPEVQLDLTELVDVDGWLVRLNGEIKGVIDNEDLEDECPLWKQRETADPAALYAQIELHLHERRNL
ncbi:hypothetical protein [Amycolatopsis sp. lyj-112]|uniref:hypothetical protein n=1 Tax=Amycolatopsis sp. lyj-112 TaxID=2789288 RepID=UPI0039789B80